MGNDNIGQNQIKIFLMISGETIIAESVKTLTGYRLSYPMRIDLYNDEKTGHEEVVFSTWCKLTPQNVFDLNINSVSSILDPYPEVIKEYVLLVKSVIDKKLASNLNSVVEEIKKMRKIGLYPNLHSADINGLMVPSASEIQKVIDYLIDVGYDVYIEDSAEEREYDNNEIQDDEMCSPEEEDGEMFSIEGKNQTIKMGETSNCNQGTEPLNIEEVENVDSCYETDLPEPSEDRQQSFDIRARWISSERPPQIS